jgi:DNA modification methylase
MSMNSPINPFYAARQAGRSATIAPEPRRPVYAKLPLAPITGSPVPELTSLYHNPEPGPYGNRRYPGNCSGNLIRDLLRYFSPRKVFDPMTGSGTCRDVCQDLGIECWSGDIHDGFDLCDPLHFHGTAKLLHSESFDFAWIHPPYWRQKRYADDPRDLSREPTLEAFLARYRLALANCVHVLQPGGKLAVLMGDYTDREEGFVPLTFHTKRLAFDLGLRQCGTDIVRFSHGASSSRKVYQSSFIPGLHDILAVFEKPSS